MQKNHEKSQEKNETNACILFEIFENGKNIEKLLEYIGKKVQIPKKQNGFTPYLLILTNIKITEKIISMEKQEKFAYINSEKFFDNIFNVNFAMFSKKRNLCIIPCFVKNITEISNAIFGAFDNNTMFWTLLDIDIDFVKNLQILIDHGFDHPYITNFCPIGHPMKTGMALVKTHQEFNRKTALTKTYYVLKEYKTNNTCCKLDVQLSKKAIQFLRQAYLKGYTQVAKQQREITGEMTVTKILEKQDKFIHIIDVDESSIESGNEENVDVSAARYNFHSHPNEAYIRHSVEKAWPSLTDYLGYFKLANKTIFHCVAAREGLYVMSFGAFWAKNLKKINIDFIRKNFKVNCRESFSPEEYTQKINNILYEGYPIFIVRFFEWNNAGTPFEVFYAKSGMSCISTQKDLEIYRQLSEKD